MRFTPVLLACLLLGCATTRISSDDPNAEIYLDYSLIGVGETEVDRVGPPREVILQAKKGGRVIGSQVMSRSFTFKTLLWGFFSYYTGWYWGWYFPERVTIPTTTTGKDSEADSRNQSLWSNPGQSVWMQPLK